MVGKIDSALYFESICSVLKKAGFPDTLPAEHYPAVRKAAKSYILKGTLTAQLPNFVIYPIFTFLYI